MHYWQATPKNGARKANSPNQVESEKDVFFQNRDRKGADRYRNSTWLGGRQGVQHRLDSLGPLRRVTGQPFHDWVNTRGSNFNRTSHHHSRPPDPLDEHPHHYTPDRRSDKRSRDKRRRN